jgi:hypothetical protein
MRWQYVSCIYICVCMHRCMYTELYFMIISITKPQTTNKTFIFSWHKYIVLDLICFTNELFLIIILYLVKVCTSLVWLPYQGQQLDVICRSCVICLGQSLWIFENVLLSFERTNISKHAWISLESGVCLGDDFHLCRHVGGKWNAEDFLLSVNWSRKVVCGIWNGCLTNTFLIWLLGISCVY